MRMMGTLVSGREFQPGASYQLELPGLDDFVLSLDMIERGPFAIAEEIMAKLSSLASVPGETFTQGQRRDERLPLAFLGGKRTRSVSLTIEPRDDGVAVQSEGLDLFAVGSNYDEALEGLAEQVDLLARQYLSTDDSRLTPSGLRLKEKLRILTSE